MSAPQSARELVAEALEQHLRPPRIPPIHEWAEEHRFLERRTTARPGKWKNYRAPYLVAIMQALDDPAVRDVVIMKGAQTGGTEAAINWILRDAHCDPGPALWVTSTDAQVRKLTSRRLDPAFDREPLLSLVSKKKGRDSDRTATAITFEQGSLGIVSSNSPAGMSSDPAQRIVFDETDRYRESAGDEGDAIALGKARQTTFEGLGAKTCAISTPKLEGSSRIAKLYEESDQGRYLVPCPECGGLQELVWYGKREEDGHEFGVLWDHDVPKEEAPSTAYYGCEFCDARWSDAQRWDATQPEAGAQWVSRKPRRAVAGFYIPSLISSFVRLSDCVDSWLKAQGKPAELQSFTNLVLGLPWSITAQEAPEFIPVEAWDGFDVPAPAVCAVAFCDVQGDRLELTVAGVGADATLYPIEHRILHGNTKLPDVWEDLERAMVLKWTRSDGKQIGLSALGIDCSYELERVCDWAAQQRSVRCYAIRGHGRGITDPIVRERLPTRSNSGRIFYAANPDAAKLQVIQRLQLTKGPGRVRYPAKECFPEEYFAQLRSEKLQRRYVRGYPVLEWHLKAGARNEALDCLAGILATLQWLNPALDVMEHTNSRLTSPPPSAAPPRAQPDERAAAAAEAPRRLAPARAPQADPPRVARRGGGAWFERGRRK